MIAKAIRVSRRLVGLPDEAVKSGEIKNDALYNWIRDVAARADVRTMLELGSSTGDGSTRAFIEGIALNPNRKDCRLYCTELLGDRFEILSKRYADNPNVKCYRVSTIALAEHVSPELVRNYVSVTQSKKPELLLQNMLRWLDEETKQMAEPGLPEDGIELIKRENGIDVFDMVLIDGSEFTGIAELDHIQGAKYILLDDINVLKNHYNCLRLTFDPKYRLIGHDKSLRNGYAIFERI